MNRFFSVPGRVLRARNLVAIAVLSGQFFTGCKKEIPEDPIVSKGRSLYFAHCTACHSFNPAVDGSVGPAIKGSALELIRARVMRADYPPGYTPKRSTHIMPRLPLEEEDVQALHAFLNSAP